MGRANELLLQGDTQHPHATSVCPSKTPLSFRWASTCPAPRAAQGTGTTSPFSQTMTLIGGGTCHSDIAAAVTLILVFVHHELLTSYRVKELCIMSAEGLFLHPLNFQPIPVPLTLVWVSPLLPIQKTRLSTGLPRRSDHWIASSHTWQTLGQSGYNICHARLIQLIWLTRWPSPFICHHSVCLS